MQISAGAKSAPPPTTACGTPGAIHDTPGEQNLTATMGIMAGLTALALACCAWLRVFSMLFSGGSVGSTTYSGLDLASTDHNLTHDEGGSQPRCS